MSSLKPLIFIMGPTCTGKSGLANIIAEKYAFEIVNCDSVQVYKHVDIGSAKPTPAEMQKYPHHLFDFIDYPIEFTAGQFRDKGLEVIDRVESPLVFVGGSGFYFTALENGMYEVEDISESIQKDLSKILDEEGSLGLHQRIQASDPGYALKISAQDSYRCKRALGLMRQLNMNMTDIQAQFAEQKEKIKLKNPILKIGLDLDREKLRVLTRVRVKKMLAGGLVQEVESHIKKGYENWAPLLSVGYKEVVDYLKNNDGDLQLLEDEIVKNTMRLAKKQRTWFKRDQGINWFDALSVQEDSSKPLLLVEEFL